MAIDWTTIATNLLGSVSGGTIANVAGALQQGGMVINHFLKDDPVKAAQAERIYLLSIEDYVNQLRNIKEGEDATDVWVNIDKLITGK